MKRFLVSFVLLCAVLLPSTAHAAIFDFAFAVQFSNGTLPGGSGPWLTGTIADGVDSPTGEVTLTFSPTGLTGTEFISSIYLNLNPVYDPDDLFGTISQTGTFFQTIQTQTNAFQADGDGIYDILLSFNTAGSGDRFQNGDTLTIVANLEGSAILMATDFAFLAAPGGGNGPFFAAAHLQGISGGLSTWIAAGGAPTPRCIGCEDPPSTVPEPASMLLLGTGLLAAVRYRRKLVK